MAEIFAAAMKFHRRSIRLLRTFTWILGFSNMLLLQYWTFHFHASLLSAPFVTENGFRDNRGVEFHDEKHPEIHQSSAVDDRHIRQFGSPIRLLTTQTGCRIARWFYPTSHNQKQYRDCVHQPRSKRLTPERATLVKDYDTIYCVFTKLQEFVDNLLDEITADIVVISGQIQIVPAVSEHTIEKLLNHEHVLHWFCQNIPVYGGRNTSHPKLSPFPYGLKEVVHKPNPQLDAYKRIFRRRFHKTELIFAGYLAPSPLRVHVPIVNESKLEPEAYFTLMAKSIYTLSPNGDRPECYRHYEALGLGTVPITGLDSLFFRHLEVGPVVFGTTDWNLTLIRENLDPRPSVNRNLILEEYWLGYAESAVHRSLNWWDEMNEGMHMLHV